MRAINGVLLRISIWFLCQFAGFHVVNRAVTFATTTQTNEVFLAYFVANTVAHVHRHAGQVRSSTAFVCRSFHDARGRSTVRAQPWLLQRLLGLGLFVARCALVRNSLQTGCLQ